MSHGRVYLDNAATSFPKPESVHRAMYDYATKVGASPGRGSYAESREGARRLTECRSLICELIGSNSPDHIIFTLNTTDALNLAIKGIVRHRLRHAPGRPIHLITTAMDHNSVLRPFNALATDEQVEWTCVGVDARTGLVDPKAIQAAIRPETALVAVVHASNVSGTVQPMIPISRLCQQAGVPLLVDAAQSVGHMPLDVNAMGIDLLAFPGHKGLMGPLGTGGLVIRPGMEHLIDPLREGGTGSRSDLDIQPLELPDRFEPGSHNTLGLVGLAEGVRWILDRGIDSIFKHERCLIEVMLDELPSEQLGYSLLGPSTPEHRCGVFSLVHETLESAFIADQLEARYGVLVRAGLHCAPRAHDTFGSSEGGGAVRLSVGAFTTEAQVRTACKGLREIAESSVEQPSTTVVRASHTPARRTEQLQ